MNDDPTCLSLPRRRGFTLIEILIVVIILGVLAAIVVPQFVNAAQSSQDAAFVANLKALNEAMMRFQLENGEFPEDGSSGEEPAGMDEYLAVFNWAETPIGGVWDTERDSFGVTSAVGVHFWGGGEVRDDAYMTGIDEMIDDGDLATGAFQGFGDGRYYWIVEQ